MPEIAICGGGNVGHALAAVLASAGSVTVLTRTAAAWNGPLLASCG